MMTESESMGSQAMREPEFSRRDDIVRSAVDNFRLEGLHMTDDDIVESMRVLDGEISMQEYVEKVLRDEGAS